MCTVSMIGDHYGDKWKDQYPWVVTPNVEIYVSKEEFEKLKAEVKEVKELLLRAKKYDAEHNEPDCSMDEKVALLKKISELVGVDLEDIFSS